MMMFLKRGEALLRRKLAEETLGRRKASKEGNRAQKSSSCPILPQSGLPYKS